MSTWNFIFAQICTKLFRFFCHPFVLFLALGLSESIHVIMETCELSFGLFGYCNPTIGILPINNATCSDSARPFCRVYFYASRFICLSPWYLLVFHMKYISNIALSLCFHVRAHNVKPRKKFFANIPTIFLSTLVMYSQSFQVIQDGYLGGLSSQAAKCGRRSVHLEYVAAFES